MDQFQLPSAFPLGKNREKFIQHPHCRMQSYSLPGILFGDPCLHFCIFMVTDYKETVHSMILQFPLSYYLGGQREWDDWFQTTNTNPAQFYTQSSIFIYIIFLFQIHQTTKNNHLDTYQMAFGKYKSADPLGVCILCISSQEFKPFKNAKLYQ